MTHPTENVDLEDPEFSEGKNVLSQIGMEVK